MSQTPDPVPSAAPPAPAAPPCYDPAVTEADLRRRIRAQIGRYVLAGHGIRRATIETAKDFKREALAKGWPLQLANAGGDFAARVGAEWAAELVAAELAAEREREARAAR
ncbi:hypothetical protein ACFOWE_17910 [Planomonospora corallina]|uniref:Uncharacterized protein n=1 Tax=Planomonospora corallina TaxID=1806052 RepID=A0ABV8I874_9ACTN